MTLFKGKEIAILNDCLADNIIPAINDLRKRIVNLEQAVDVLYVKEHHAEKPPKDSTVTP